MGYPDGCERDCIRCGTAVDEFVHEQAIARPQRRRRVLPECVYFCSASDAFQPIPQVQATTAAVAPRPCAPKRSQART